MREKGIFEMAGNYEPQIAAPLDARNAVESKADLTNPATWQDTSGAVYLYEGLLVAVTNDSTVENNGIYKLVDADNYTQDVSWVRMLDAVDLDGVNEDITGLHSFIEAEIADVEKNISAIQTGIAQIVDGEQPVGLANNATNAEKTTGVLTVEKDGESIATFNGSSNAEIDISQNVHIFRIPVTDIRGASKNYTEEQIYGFLGVANISELKQIVSRKVVVEKYGITLSGQQMQYNAPIEYLETTANNHINIVFYGPDSSDGDNFKRFDITIIINGNTSTITSEATSFEGAIGPTGPQGEIGPMGPTGPTGATGPQGEAGQDGAAGVVGPTGPTGPAGADGVDGAEGPQGPQGETGPVGPTGAIGPTGPQGEAGPAGQDGAVGATGPQGEIGPTGPTGPRGNDGTGVTILGSYTDEEALRQAHPTGNPGDAYLVQGDLYVWSATENDWDNVGNIQGPQGDTGPQGEVGPTGPTGAPGLIGPTGPQGEKGQTGDAGPQGDVGPTGPTGPAGENGAAGEQGPIGPTGPTGSAGLDALTFSGNLVTDVEPYMGQSFKIGRQALSRTPRENDDFIALIRGEDDTEVADRTWIASMTVDSAAPDSAETHIVNFLEITGSIGPTGPQGTTGEQGPTGDTGPQGPVGPTGADGLPGAEGPVGPTGATGEAGQVGPTGPTGAQGDTGLTGPTGPTGPAGENGATGEVGPTGPTGPQGAAGAEGPVGPTGPEGPIGQFTEDANWVSSDASELGSYMHTVSSSQGKGNYPSVTFIETSTHREWSGVVVYPNSDGTGIKIYSNTNSAGIIVVRP